jgi:hypothetical protein
MKDGTIIVNGNEVPYRIAPLFEGAEQGLRPLSTFPDDPEIFPCDPR